MKSHLQVIHRSPKSSKTALLKVKSLSKWFETANGRIPILQDVNFEVSPGEIICISGRSGCGKTTMLKMLAGFVRPSGGTVLLADQPVSKPGPERCVIFQEDALFPWLTVRENIAFGLKGTPRRHAPEVERFIELVGLQGYEDYLPDKISGGMKQRVALARVLIMKPDVLLLDEPFAALDPQTREQMQDLLLSLCRKLSHTVLFVTHDVEEAALLADRVLLFDKSCHGIKKIFDVPLPRPRRRHDKGFMALCRDVVETLRGKAD